MAGLSSLSLLLACMAAAAVATDVSASATVTSGAFSLSRQAPEPVGRFAHRGREGDVRPFSIAADVSMVPMGGSVRVIVTSFPFPASLNGTVFVPFVNNTQWGAPVTCAISGRQADDCFILLPLTYAGTAAVQLAVLAGGREWCLLPMCMFPVGQPMPEEANKTLLARSNVLDIGVTPRTIPNPRVQGHSVCMDWEPWFTPQNIGSTNWIHRPGVEGIPIVGMYDSFNPTVVRQHAIWLAEAGVDCILVDWSNNIWGGIPWAARSVGVQQLINGTTYALDQYALLRAEGIPTPQVIIMIGYVNGPAAAPSALRDEAAWIEENYIQKYGAEHFVQLDGKPVLVVLDTRDQSPPPLDISDSFAIRYMSAQTQNTPAGKNGIWSWMDGSLTPTVAYRDGIAEAVTATPGYFAQGGWLGEAAEPIKGGGTFITTMQVAVQARPKVLLICQWNEFAGQPGGPPGSFEDSYNATLTNDMEPISLSECGYTRPGDKGQLPRCDTGWGFLLLNVLSASLAQYRDVLNNVPAQNQSSIIRITTPTKGNPVFTSDSCTIAWATLGPVNQFEVLVTAAPPFAPVHRSVGSATSVTLDCSSWPKDAPIQISVSAPQFSTRYALSKYSVDKPSAVPLIPQDVINVTRHVEPITATVSSAPVDFFKLDSVPPYEYGPSIIQEDGVMTMFYCSPGQCDTYPNCRHHDGSWDYVRMTTSRDGMTWTSPQVALRGDQSFDFNSTCDPSIVKFRGTYILYYTCISMLASDGYTNNRVCAALADDINGPWHKVGPVAENLDCTKDYQKAYCVGQPSAIVKDNQVFLFFSSIGAAGDPTAGPNPGSIRLVRSTDGVHFEPVSSSPILYTQHNCDVKFDRALNKFVMVQGDVGSNVLTWSLSNDGISWLPFEQGQRQIATNPSLPANGTNNNPGLAGLPDGSFGGRTFVAYGSSYGADKWGDWHLYRSNLWTSDACGGCAPLGCDFACSASGKTQFGSCAVPNSTDPGHCCSCAPYPSESPCDSCLGPGEKGCNEACVAAGHKAGACGAAKGPGDCCVCFD